MGVRFGWMRLVSRVVSGGWFPIFPDGGSIGPALLGDHFSGRAVASTIGSGCSQHPTRSPFPWTRDALSRGDLLGLARGGVCNAPLVTKRAVRSYRTISTLPVTANRPSAVCFLWHFPSLATDRFWLFERVGVTHHLVLSCSDFPLAGVCPRAIALPHLSWEFTRRGGIWVRKWVI